MSFLKKIFGGREKKALSYKEFWGWFQQNEKTFYNVVKQKSNVERDFFNKLSPKLGEVKEGFFYLTGMFDKDTVELVITPDGVIKNIVFCEELVAAAPETPGWKFTALKQPMDITDLGIEMAGYKFNGEKLRFYSNNHADFPDEIDITVVYEDFTEDNKATIINGTYIFLDNYLGEAYFATAIDNLMITGPTGVQDELIPLEKLKDFLLWRHKEFVEKYEGVRHNTENNNYSAFNATLKNGNPVVAIINTDLLNWDAKASHPWVMTVEIKYDGKNNNGMPNDEAFELLSKIEDDIMLELKDIDGYLNIGRQTADSRREIYFACRDFRNPSKVLHHTQAKYADKVEIEYDIYKDKYWRSFNRFMPN